MKRNIEELQLTLQDIEDHPECWDQEVWVCGTTACYAGRVALRHGCQQILDSQGDDWIRRGSEEWGYTTHQRILSPLGEKVVVADFAQEVLGLDDYEAELLFRESNTLEDLRYIIKGLVNGDSVEFIKDGMI